MQAIEQKKSQLFSFALSVKDREKLREIAAAKHRSMGAQLIEMIQEAHAKLRKKQGRGADRNDT